LSFLLPLSIVACTNKNEKDSEKQVDKNIKVVVHPAEAMIYQDAVYATGRLAFENEYKLSFKTAGIIDRILVKEGQHVEKDQLLASLKLDEINAKAQQAENALAKADRDYKRIQALYKDSVATLEQLQNAESQYKHAQLDLESAHFTLRYSQINAPNDGVIQYINEEENEAIQAGSPIILFGVQSKSKILKTTLSDADVVKVAPGDSALVQFDAYKNTTFSGVIEQIAGTADPSTGTFEVKIKISDPNEQLKSGFIGTANIISSTKQVFIKIPIESLVVADGNVGEVYVAIDQNAKKRSITIYQISEQYLLVSDGIQAGEKIVVGGLQNLSKDTEPIEY
jgi:RND family efflux transporter MFP subunit